MITLLILAFITGTILSLWCSNERKLLQSENQEQARQHTNGPEHGETQQYTLYKSYV